jgi:hypothetical protein
MCPEFTRSKMKVFAIATAAARVTSEALLLYNGRTGSGELTCDTCNVSNDVAELNDISEHRLRAKVCRPRRCSCSTPLLISF